MEFAGRNLACDSSRAFPPHRREMFKRLLVAHAWIREFRRSFWTKPLIDMAYGESGLTAWFALSERRLETSFVEVS